MEQIKRKAYNVGYEYEGPITEYFGAEERREWHNTSEANQIEKAKEHVDILMGESDGHIHDGKSLTAWVEDLAVEWIRETSGHHQTELEVKGREKALEDNYWAVEEVANHMKAGVQDALLEKEHNPERVL